MFPKQSDVLAYRSVYGDPRGRNGQASATWMKANLIPVTVPFKMSMGDIPIKRITVHRACAASLGAVLDAIWIAAKRDQGKIDEWGMNVFSGSFNYRPMRGLTTLSMHAFGCAVDFDAPRNGLGDSTPRFANYPAVLDAFKAQGWTWGGRWSRPDGMHFQAATI